MYFSSVGLIVAVLRMFEPIVFDTFKKDISSLCKKKPKPGDFVSDGPVDAKIPENTDLLTDTLNSFLTSSLNVELVYTIL